MRSFSRLFYTLYRKIKDRKKGCIISIRSCIGKRVKLEGDNYIGMDTLVQDCSLGRMSYIGDNCTIVNAVIGRYSSIASGFNIFSGLHPTTGFVSTHPAFYAKTRAYGKCYVKQDKFEEYRYVDRDKKIEVSIGNDVWIASDVSVFAGVTIGDGSIIAAGSLVTHDVPPYAVVMGRPAKVIRYRFDKETIDWLMKVRWWSIKEQFIESKAELFEDISKFRLCFENEDMKDNYEYK